MLNELLASVQGFSIPVPVTLVCACACAYLLGKVPSDWNQDAETLCRQHYGELLDVLDEAIQHDCVSLLALSFVDETMVNPVFALTDAVGTVMRKRLRPVSDEVLFHINRLWGSEVPMRSRSRTTGRSRRFGSETV